MKTPIPIVILSTFALLACGGAAEDAPPSDVDPCSCVAAIDACAPSSSCAFLPACEGAPFYVDAFTDTGRRERTREGCAELGDAVCCE